MTQEKISNTKALPLLVGHEARPEPERERLASSPEGVRISPGIAGRKLRRAEKSEMREIRGGLQGSSRLRLHRGHPAVAGPGDSFPLQMAQLCSSRLRASSSTPSWLYGSTLTRLERSLQPELLVVRQKQPCCEVVYTLICAAIMFSRFEGHMTLRALTC